MEVSYDSVRVCRTELSPRRADYDERGVIGWLLAGALCIGQCCGKADIRWQVGWHTSTGSSAAIFTSFPLKHRPTSISALAQIDRTPILRTSQPSPCGGRNTRLFVSIVLYASAYLISVVRVRGGNYRCRGSLTMRQMHRFSIYIHPAADHPLIIATGLKSRVPYFSQCGCRKSG